MCGFQADRVGGSAWFVRVNIGSVTLGVANAPDIFHSSMMCVKCFCASVCCVLFLVGVSVWFLL